MGLWDVVDRREELGYFSFFYMVNFFESSDGGACVFGFCGGIDRVRSVEDGGVGYGIFIGATRSGAVVVFVEGRHGKEVEVREERRVLVEVCETFRGYARK